jgi:hypothetical protein
VNVDLEKDAVVEHSSHLIAPLLNNRSLEAERGTLHLSFTRRRKPAGAS